jgi:hypothetical protein
MRKSVGIALLVLLAVGLFFVLPQNESRNAGSISNVEAAPLSFGIYSAEIADSSGENAAVLRLFRFGGENESAITVFCSEKPLQRNVLLLQTASAPGVGRELAAKIGSELAKCGFSSRNASAEDALSSENSLVIAAAGATPQALVENKEVLAEKNDRVIVVESLSRRVIDESGKLLPANGSTGFEIVMLEPGKEGAAALEAARRAIFSNGSGSARIGNSQGNFTIAVAANASLLYCRAIYLSNASVCRVADTGALSKPEGKLEGPAIINEGSNAAFEFSLANGSELGRDLKFYALLYRGREKIARQEIAGGKINEGWASVFAMNVTQGGKYVLRVEDQFGRVHAAAYFEALWLDVAPVSQSGNRYEFYAKVGDEPINGMVDAWIDDGEKKQFYASSGTLVVWASPAAGNRVMHFGYSGMENSYQFTAKGGGIVDAYIRLGVPALAFLLAVYFLLRAGRKVKYTITFPQFARQVPKIVLTDAQQLKQAWRFADRRIGGYQLAIQPEEMADALVKQMGLKETRINAYSVQRALRELAKNGEFSEDDGLFAPKEALDGFSIAELRVLRLLHDLMLERGLKFEKKKRLKLAGSGLELVLFEGKGSVLENIGKKRRAIVFESRESLEEFEDSLEEPEKDGIRIKLALSNGKILFVAATRNEVEPILP